MANILTKNPYVLDTTGTVVVAGNDADAMMIDFVRWVGATTAGHQCLLKDAAGGIIFDSYATGSNYVEQAPIRKRYNGLTLTTLASGTLYIYRDVSPKRY